VSLKSVGSGTTYPKVAKVLLWYITAMSDRTLVYNQAGRLKQVEENTTVLAEYAYNALGQRVTKTLDTAVTVFHYDFDGNLIAESASDGTFSKEYIHALGNRFAMVDVAEDKVYYYMNDHLGTPIFMTDEKNIIVWEGTYQPFGLADVSPSVEIENNFRFAGQYFDAETGLHYNYHRYYDPKTGRYITPDPIGLAGGINPYTYTSNNPINATDPLGLLTEVIVTGGNWYGHAAININGTVYSSGRYNPDSANSFGMKGDNIMLVQEHSNYVNYYKNKGRNSAGYILDISPADEQKIKKYFDDLIKNSAKWKFGHKLPDDYSFLSENCATNVTDGLQEGLSWFNDLWLESMSPYQLEMHLKAAPWLVDKVVQYPGEKNN